MNPLEKQMSKEIQTYESMLIDAFRSCFQKYQELGPEGMKVKMLKPNGEKALVMDYEAEETVLEIFKNIPALWVTEEHGQIQTKLTEKPKIIGVVDGIDGTTSFAAGGDAVTMLSILPYDKPLYKNTLVGGMLHYPTGNIYLATMGGGAWEITNDGNRNKINSSKNSQFDLTSNIIYLDLEFDAAIGEPTMEGNFLSKINPDETRINSHFSSGIQMLYVAMGKAQLTLEATRGAVKGQVEFPSAYRIVSEAGGSIQTLDGEDLGEQNFLEFGNDRPIPLVVGCNHEITQSAVKYFNSSILK